MSLYRKRLDQVSDAILLEAIQKNNLIYLTEDGFWMPIPASTVRCDKEGLAELRKSKTVHFRVLVIEEEPKPPNYEPTPFDVSWHDNWLD